MQNTNLGINQIRNLPVILTITKRFLNNELFLTYNLSHGWWIDSDSHNHTWLMKSRFQIRVGFSAANIKREWFFQLKRRMNSSMKSPDSLVFKLRSGCSGNIYHSNYANSIKLIYAQGKTVAWIQFRDFNFHRFVAPPLPFHENYEGCKILLLASFDVPENVCRRLLFLGLPPS